MSRQDISLSDRYDLAKDVILLNGTQALVRLVLMQRARDALAGINSAGLVTGYRGSPLGAVDTQMDRAKSLLEKANVTFQPGLNEDLAATALWGAQQAELRGEGKFDGVFGLWYGKGPGVDRSGDVMRHANMAGTSRFGGVVMAMGDDHTGESSTTLHQSDWAMVDAYMPILSPAGVQEILDFGLYAWALSRFAGVWTGLKLMKDTVEVTSVVQGNLERMQFVEPAFEMPEGGLNIRLVDTAVERETRVIDHKRIAAEAFAKANKIDQRVWGKPGAKIGFVAAGKNWLDLQHALALLGIDADEAARLGLTTYKVGQVWPLEMSGFRDWSAGLDLIIVVEEKRKLIEVQIKEAIFDERAGTRVYGGHKGGASDHGPRAELFSARYALDPTEIAEKLGSILVDEGRRTDRIEAGLARLAEAKRSDNAQDIAARLPYFCSGCPHNSSTKVPDGSRAYAGIGCHFMVQWMDRETMGFTQMGGEGANWIGEAPFSTREHVFQNLGDGTYNHSGILAIRAAIAAGTTMTYKILFNDAVAMTGGQHNEGGLGAAQIVAELQAMGVRELALVYDEKEDINLNDFPSGLASYERSQLPDIQEKMSKTKGVSAIVYVQTCAAEKRRRRKRGTFPDPDRRIFINPDICEGCGDCGVQSNCVSIVPFETDFGRKRAIDQSSCNKDFSCVNGFCPSFVSVSGAKIKKEPTADIKIDDLPEPVLPRIDGTHNIVITGVGGTGVVTIGAILAMAAHLDGKGAGMMEMAGLAQKGGAVHIHCRLANTPEDISAIRVAIGEADAVLGGDLVVTAGAKTLALMAAKRTGAVVNTHEITTGDFTRDTKFQLPGDRLKLSLEAKLQDKLALFDASDLAKSVMGDSIYSNMILMGAAWQKGLIPLNYSALIRAIELNGASPGRNLRAFEIGRWTIAHPDQLERFQNSQIIAKPISLDEKISTRADHLQAYQGPRLARRYRKTLETIHDPELKAAVADGYHKILSYKDEYEVARLHLKTRDKLKQTFEGDLGITYHLAPPLLSRMGSNGRAIKRDFGPFIERGFKLLSVLKFLRKTPFDPFGYTNERKMERALIKQYEQDLELVKSARNVEAACALARLPLDIVGFGPVKEKNAEKAKARREEILVVLNDEPQMKTAAE